MSASPKPVRKKRKKRAIPINPETGVPFSAGTMKMRLLKRLKCTQKFEKLAWESGAKLVAGVDEVGRGCLFGPVVAAAVILEPGYRIKGLRDSKLIDRETRERLAERIKQHSIAYAVATVDVARIDQPLAVHARQLRAERHFDRRERQVHIEATVARVDEREALVGLERPNLFGLQKHQALLAPRHDALGLLRARAA